MYVNDLYNSEFMWCVIGQSTVAFGPTTDGQSQSAALRSRRLEGDRGLKTRYNTYWCVIYLERRESKREHKTDF